MWETIRGYLTFTRKERFGVLFLLTIISVLFVLPYFFRDSPGDPDPAAYEKMKSDIQKFEMRLSDSSSSQGKNNRISYITDDRAKAETINETEVSHPDLFYFDPNKLGAGEWRRLGLSDRLTQTILHYLQKGGHFKKAEDLKKLYGLRPSEYDRISPYVRIASLSDGFKARSFDRLGSADHFEAAVKRDSVFREMRTANDVLHSSSSKFFSMTDINQADSEAWKKFPGIGEKLASRIIHFREKLGGFYQTDQVGETFGLPDSTFKKIKPYLVLRSVNLNRIDINAASKEILQAHPYIRWQIAKSITDYRLQHGAFHSSEELLQLAGMDSAKFEKLKPYLVVK